MPKKTGPKPENGLHRVRICGGGPFVRADTLATLNAWQTIYGVSRGRIIDALMDHCKADPKFSITFKTK